MRALPQTNRRRGLVLALPVTALMALTAWTACGDDSGDGAGSGGGSGGPSGQAIVIKDFKFEPQTLQVAPGAKVTVKNEDGAAHTVTAGDGSFDTGSITGSGQAEVAAPGAGQVSYRCDIHQYMTGVIQVSSS